MLQNLKSSLKVVHIRCMHLRRKIWSLCYVTWDCYSEEQVSGNLINSSESYNIKVIRLENDAKLLISQSLNKHTFAVYTIGIKFVQVGKQLVGSPYTMFNRDRNLSYMHYSNFTVYCRYSIY